MKVLLETLRKHLGYTNFYLWGFSQCGGFFSLFIGRVSWLIQPDLNYGPHHTITRNVTFLYLRSTKAHQTSGPIRIGIT